MTRRTVALYKESLVTLRRLPIPLALSTFCDASRCWFARATNLCSHEGHREGDRNGCEQRAQHSTGGAIEDARDVHLAARPFS